MNRGTREIQEAVASIVQTACQHPKVEEDPQIILDVAAYMVCIAAVSCAPRGGEPKEVIEEFIAHLRRQDISSMTDMACSQVL